MERDLARCSPEHLRQVIRAIDWPTSAMEIVTIAETRWSKAQALRSGRKRRRYALLQIDSLTEQGFLAPLDLFRTAGLL
jgi:hypothetical protein